MILCVDRPNTNTIRNTFSDWKYQLMKENIKIRGRINFHLSFSFICLAMADDGYLHPRLGHGLGETTFFKVSAHVTRNIGVVTWQRLYQLITSDAS